ncbi:fatty acid desaturase [Cyanobium sp. ATX 6F1]|uniref:fatty acid desaturase n=1 Tax=Cyanobium sp. ATX 6F1 TaxID=2823702 RepID=UPI0020CBA978|nr:fatty acid desaturase [Cyanobium sp. ATX 6F1]
MAPTQTRRPLPPMPTDTLQATPSRADFSLRPYMASNDWWASWQLINTLVPFGLLWWAIGPAVRSSLWLAVPIVVLMVLLSARCFSLMHDCGHASLFSSPKVNRAVGFLLGVINAIPQYPWSRGHDYHHRHNGNWELYRGPSALITTGQFLALSPRRQWFYAFLRQPLMLIPGGFFYLIIKPRLALVLGLVGLVRHGLDCRREDPSSTVAAIFASYRSRHWYTTGEFWDLLGNNICVLSLWALMGHWLGLGLFWSVYSIVMACSAAIFICIFFVQHNYEGSYAHRSEDWSYLKGAIEGSSYLKMPALLNWFSADIGYHNMHHLSARIPNYRLREAHQANAHLLTGVHTLRLAEIPNCFKFILWDPATDSLTSIEAVRQQAALGFKGSNLPELPTAVGASGVKGREEAGQRGAATAR